jgi:hypothetical protein
MKFRRFNTWCWILVLLAAGRPTSARPQLESNRPNDARIPFQYLVIDAEGPASCWGKGVGDLNGDGRTDLVTGGYNGGGLNWYMNPTWDKFVIDASARVSTDVEVIDINRDGRNDVVIVTYNPGSLLWYEQTDHGWKQHKLADDTLHDIELADLNNDGKIDIVGRNQGATGGAVLYLYAQQSPDVWSRDTLSIAGGEGLKVADLNRDGNPDVIINGAWYENTGDIGETRDWPKHVYSSSWTWPMTYIDTGDLNNDGRLDLVVSPSESKKQFYHLSWFEAPVDPTAEWIEHVLEENVECVYHFIGIADFNRDGKADIATAMMQQGVNPNVKLYLNNGRGASWTKQVVGETSSHSMKILDVDNNGNASLFGANWNDNPTEIQLWKNTTPPIGMDNFTYLEADSSRAARYFGLAFDDLTHDGFQDIISGKYFYRNPGGAMTGIWPRTDFPIDADALLTVDVDGDMLGDVIAMDGEGVLYWLEARDQAGVQWNVYPFDELKGTDHHLSTQGYTVGQLVPGGRPEIIIHHRDGIYYYEIPKRNPEITNWQRVEVTDIFSIGAEGIAAGDFDRDGLIDVCASVDDNSRLAWWKNPGDGTANWMQYEIGSIASPTADRVLLADFNEDGRLDCVTCGANGTANGVYWFEAPDDPTGSNWTLHTVVNYGKDNSVNNLDAADIDHDGHVDIVAGVHIGDLKISIWKNDGRGNFAEHVIDTGHGSHLGTRLTDLDYDGDLDIVNIAWRKFKYMFILRNDNTGELVRK